MTEKPKRKYTRKKKAMTPATLEGYQEGLSFATSMLSEKDGTEYLAGHMQGMAFAIKHAPAAKRRAAYGSRKKSGAKPGPKPKAKKKAS